MWVEGEVPLSFFAHSANVWGPFVNHPFVANCCALKHYFVSQLMITYFDGFSLLEELKDFMHCPLFEKDESGEEGCDKN